MGSMVSLPISSLWQKKEYRILIAGPFYSGKTTILFSQLKNYGPIETVPTVAFNVESLTHGGMNFVCWDIGGRHTLRPEWGVYIAQTNAIIFVVDSTDIRLDDAANELTNLLNLECMRQLSDAPLLVFANKQDLKGAKSPVEIAEALHLRELGDRIWNIAPCSATDGVGISGGMDWLVQALKSQRKSQRA
ncbi:hypothetical protein N7519_006155 [Penicillium mononematosum]|uniref:uncharacterized protein n=1 Tax=Penicillium mononematosum TaxID=268346 RepID=UPI0025470704|nr:uncharacterized protein N7519_006155 [Penicillium mononematosum]KAJ6184854.1 hypothetical protein N7519_006155 [Penicillium mononematosum]